MNAADAEQLWTDAGAGDREALDRIFSELEQSLRASSPEFETLWAARPRPSQRAHRVGLVGPPGTGKSTVLAQLAADGPSPRPLGVVSIDATGNCGDGTRLGDRLRMNALRLDDHVRLRTVEARPGDPAPGLLASSAADVFESLGCEPIYIESVGLARSQVEIVRRVHTVVLLVPPTIEEPERLASSGLLDLADLVVLNKCDLEGAAEVADLLDATLAKRAAAGGLRPGKVFRLRANRGEGVEELREAIASHGDGLRAGDAFTSRSRAQVAEQLRHWYFELLELHFANDVGLRSLLDEAAGEVLDGRRDLYEVAREIAEQTPPPRR